MSIRIFSFNVNGIRSVINKGFVDWLKLENPDIISLQEIKANKDQFDEQIFKDLGYHCYWYSAEKKGYSGVGLLTKLLPIRISYGIGIPTFDIEGRVIFSEYENFNIVSVYFPSGTSGDLRQNVKMEFLRCFFDFINNAIKSGKPLIISGDYNIAHTEIDINNPKKHIKTSGFLPEEREWFTEFLSLGLLDTFRLFNNKEEQYSWWTYRAGAKEKNLGWRIDYHLASESLKPSIVNANIYSNVSISDHCPVSIELKF
jgi:exodeoxyribonuclease III